MHCCCYCSVTKLYPTLCDPMDDSMPGSIMKTQVQFLTLKIHRPSVLFVSVCACMLSHFSRVRLFATPWTVASQAPLSMGFSRQEYWSGLPFPSRGDLPNPGMELRSPTLQADSLPYEPPGKPNVLWYWLSQTMVQFRQSKIVYMIFSSLNSTVLP